MGQPVADWPWKHKALLAIALMHASLGASYIATLTPTRFEAFRWLPAEHFTVQALGGMWLAGAVFCAAGAVAHRGSRFHRVAWALALVPMAFFALAWSAAWVVDLYRDGPLQAGVFLPNVGIYVSWSSLVWILTKVPGVHDEEPSDA